MCWTRGPITHAWAWLLARSKRGYHGTGRAHAEVIGTMRFRRLNEQSSFLRSVREARRPIDDPIQRLSEPRVRLLTGRCSPRTYANFDAVFYDWITSRLSAGCRYYTVHRWRTCLISLLTRMGRKDNSHQAKWRIIRTNIYSMLSFIVVIYLSIPLFVLIITVYREISDLYRIADLNRCIHLCFALKRMSMNGCRWNEQEIIKNLTIECRTSNRCKKCRW